MVGASDVDSSSAYSTSSSSNSEDEGDRRKNKKLSKNLSGLSCFARDEGPIRRTREGGSEWAPIKKFFSKEMETPTG
jgi:hypothetical protein